MKIALIFVFVLVCGLATGSVSPKPSFSTLKNDYPTYSSISSSSFMRSLGFPSSWNSCATRVSHAFNEAGYTLDITRSDNCNWSRSKVSGVPYIIRVNTFLCYLKKRWGVSPQSVTESSVRGKTGIIIFKSCPWSDATGHIDLWDGSRCLGKCTDSRGHYFSQCKKFLFFDL